MKRVAKRGWNTRRRKSRRKSRRRRRRSSDKGLEKGERRGGRSIAAATGAGNASLGYPVTKLVRFVQRGPRYVGLSPLKMVQLKPHCSDAAALERDTASFASKTGSKFLVCRAFIGDHKSPTGVVFPVIEISLPIDAFGVRLPMSPSIYEIFRHRLRRGGGHRGAIRKDFPPLDTVTFLPRTINVE